MKKPWPTKEAMIQVYEKNLWGGNTTDFYSGEGSHNPEIIVPYIHSVSSFLSAFKTKLSVCDLGCGDFNIGSQLIQYTSKYAAVDIVPALIDRNKILFKAAELEFHCLDISKDDLPSADCAIIRQVLQHLSNAEILQIIPKLASFKYIIVTEHLPEGSFEPNVDIISGQGIRLKKRSGVNLVAPPFNLKVAEEKTLLNYSLGNGKGVILTTIYKTA